MKLKLVFVLMVLFPAFCNAQYTWHSLPTAPTSWRFDDFYFVNPNLGWVINPSYNYLGPNQYGRICKTTDGGNTWQILIDNSTTFFRSVGFADSLNGWVGNIADTSKGPGGIPFTTDTIPLYQTHDGGTTWTPAPIPYPHPAGICGISVVTDSIVYAYGRYFGPAGYLKTTNKGASWVYKDMSSQALGLIDGHFFNKDTGLITGGANDNTALILYTTDGGTSWTTVYHATRVDTERVWKIYFPSRNIGYATIEYEGSLTAYNTWFLKTIDGGLTWTEHPFIANYDLEGLGFINDSTGWIGGDFLTGTYITHDGGNTWAIDATFGVATPPYETAPTGFSINRFRSFGDTLMYASGNTIYKLNTNTTAVSDLQNAPFIVDNYPNPYTGQTTIAYTLPYAASNIVLQVTNVLGQNVFTKNIGAQNAGVNQFLFTEKLSPGVYYYSVNSDKFRVTKKMIVAN